MSANSPDPAEFLSEMQALALIALQDSDLAVANLAPIKVRENAVFRIDLADGRKAVLRVHRSGYHSDAELDSEFVWMRALQAAGIEVPRVIRSRHGRDFEVIACASEQCTADRRIRVDRGAPTRIGRKRHRRRRCRHRGAVSDDRRHRPRACTQPYRGLAAAAGIPAPRLGRRGAGGGATALGPVLELAALTPAEMKLLTRVRAAIAADLQDYGTKSDRYGLIHADLVPENLLIDGNRVQVIDFDDAGFGWHLFELATSLYFIAGDEIYPTAREALISGDRTERELPDEALDGCRCFLPHAAPPISAGYTPGGAPIRRVN